MTPSASCCSSCQHTFSRLREGWLILREKGKPLEGMLIKLSHKGLTLGVQHHPAPAPQQDAGPALLAVDALSYVNHYSQEQIPHDTACFCFWLPHFPKIWFSSGFMSVSLSDLPGCSWLVGMPRCLIFFVIGVEELKDSEDGQHKPQQSWLYKSAWKALGRRSRVKMKWNIKTNAWAYYQVES